MKLKGLINVEFKFKDTAFAQTPSQTGSITYLNLIAQGDTTQTRDGAQFRCKSIEVRFQNTMAVLGGPQHTRVLLGIHKNVNSTTLVPADVLEALDPNSPRRYDNQKNVIILKEWMFAQMNSQANSIVVKKYHSDLDLITRYQSAATSAVIAGVEQGGLFMLTIGNNTSNLPAFTCTTRLRYIDN